MMGGIPPESAALPPYTRKPTNSRVILVEGGAEREIERTQADRRQTRRTDLDMQGGRTNWEST